MKIYGTLRPSTCGAILEIRWHDFVRNTEVLAAANLPSIQDIITTTSW